MRKELLAELGTSFVKAAEVRDRAEIDGREVADRPKRGFPIDRGANQAAGDTAVFATSFGNPDSGVKRVSIDSFYGLS